MRHHVVCKVYDEHEEAIFKFRHHVVCKVHAEDEESAIIIETPRCM